MWKIYNKKQDRSNLIFNLLCGSILGLIIQITANFTLAFRFNPIT